MEQTHAETAATRIAPGTPVEELTGQERPATGEGERELMAPGHLYNSRNGTGIEWLPAGPDTGEPGRVRLWSRQWNEEPIVVAEAEHRTASPWEYWYNLEFADSFPQVTHWWFGDAWTGIVRIWQPEGVGRDPESGAPMLSGWLSFSPTEKVGVDGEVGEEVEGVAPPLPWTVLLSNPMRVNAPLPPMFAYVANLPLQLLLAETIVEMLGTLAKQVSRGDDGTTGDVGGHLEVALTSLVRREDLYRAFPTEFGPWRLDRLPDLTPREALCRVQGL
jgi:hypothetical protein